MTNRAVSSIAILAGLVGYPMTMPGASWTNISIGLTGQAEGVRALAIHPNGSTLYALGNQTFKSTDGGSTWRMLGGIVGAGVLALDPVSPSTLYAGSGHGVWKSKDDGETWVFSGLPGQSITTLAIDPHTPTTLYAGSLRDEVYRSLDGGTSWTGFSVGISDPHYGGVGSILIDPSTPSTLYLIAAGLGSPLYKSTDGGQTWSIINNGPVFRLLGITATGVYAILRGVSISLDGGATWKSTAPSMDAVSLVFDPANSNLVYASASAPVGSPPSLYKSIDGGQSWSEWNANMPFAGSLALNPANPSVLYGASYPGGVFQSADGGRNWSARSAGLSATNIQVLITAPSDPPGLYAGGDGGLFTLTPAGWKLVSSFRVAGGGLPGLPPPVTGIPSPGPAGVHSMLIDYTKTSTFYLSTARIGGCLATDVLLYKSVDAGSTWSDSINPNMSGCSDDALLGMDPTDPNTLYLRWGDDYDGYGLRKTTDGGASWNYTGLYANALNALVIKPGSASMLYAGTDNGVLRSTDGGETWKLLGLANANVNLLAADPVNPNTLYATATAVYPATFGFLGVFRSTDGGASWSSVNRGLEAILANSVPVNALVIDPEHTSVLYLATSGYGVFRSIDGGMRWTPFNHDLTNLDVRTLSITRAPAETLYAGTPEGIFCIAEPEAQPSNRRPPR